MMEMSELISHARILSSKQQGGVVAVTIRKGEEEGRGERPDNRLRPIQFKTLRVNVSAVEALT